MITLNGNKFALTDGEFDDSLFSDKTCNGFYELKKGVVWIYDHTKTLCGVITRTNILASARRIDNGNIWYSYADVTPVGRYPSYSQKCKEVKNVRTALISETKEVYNSEINGYMAQMINEALGQ